MLQLLDWYIDWSKELELLLVIFNPLLHKLYSNTLEIDLNMFRIVNHLFPKNWFDILQ